MLSNKGFASLDGSELDKTVGIKGFDGRVIPIRSSYSVIESEKVTDIEYRSIDDLKSKASSQLKKLNSVGYRESYTEYFKAIPEPENIFLPELIRNGEIPEEEPPTYLKPGEEYSFWKIISATILVATFLPFGLGGVALGGVKLGGVALGGIVLGGVVYNSAKYILPAVRDKWNNFWASKPEKENKIEIDYEKKYSELMEAVKNTTESFYKLNNVRMKTILRLYFISHTLRYTSRIQEEIDFVKNIFLMKEVLEDVNQQSLKRSFYNKTLKQDKKDVIDNLVMIRAYIEVIREEFVEKSKIEEDMLRDFSREINYTVGLLQRSKDPDNNSEIGLEIASIIAKIESNTPGSTISSVASTARNDMLVNIRNLYNTIRALEQHMYQQDPNLDSEMEEFKNIVNGLDILVIKVAEATTSKELVSSIDEFNFHYERRPVEAMGSFANDMESLDRIIEDYSPWFTHHKYNHNRDSFVSYNDENKYSRFWRQYDIGEKSSVEIIEDFNNNLEKYEDEFDVPLYDISKSGKTLPDSRSYFVDFNNKMSVGIGIEDITMIWFIYRSMLEDEKTYSRYREGIHGIGSYVINRLFKHGIVKNINNERMEWIAELEEVLYQNHGVVVGLNSLSGRVDPDLNSLLNFSEINSLTMNVTPDTYDLLRKFLIEEDDTPLEKIENSVEREVKLFLNWIEYFVLFQLLDVSDITYISDKIQKYIDAWNYYNLKTIIVIMKITDYINKTIIQRNLLLPTIRDGKMKDVLDKALKLFELRYSKENEFLDQIDKIENKNIREALKMSVYR